MREHIHVAVPTMNNQITMHLHGFLLSLERTNWSQEEFAFSYDIVNGLQPVEYARNVLVGNALKTDASRVWFIDQDMMPDKSIYQMLAADADIVGARMIRFDHCNPSLGKQTGISPCAMIEKKDSPGRYYPAIPIPDTPAVQQVDAVGTGCVLVRREVLEDRRMWGDGVYTNLDGEERNCQLDYDDARFAPPVFRFPRKPNGQPIMGEDVDFCRRAKALGYKIATHWNAKCGHYKSVDLDQVVDLASMSVQRAGSADELDRRFKALKEIVA